MKLTKTKQNDMKRNDTKRNDAKRHETTRNRLKDPSKWRTRNSAWAPGSKHSDGDCDGDGGMGGGGGGDGCWVAVKVRRRGVQRRVLRDLRLMQAVSLG
jgi:predicted unusual protein kinase regulating ubiquinone biosynthesis (AarF/ABC1/UbiB family)